MELDSKSQDRRSAGPGAYGAEFRHEAFLYSDPDGFLAGTLPFIREGIGAGESVLVAVNSEKIARLKAALGEDDAAAVHFMDMEQIGRNPARIIPVWREFVEERGGQGIPIRGIGEPVWPGRTPDEIDEAQRHEALLNLAFADAPAWWLMCPYDAAGLPDEVIAAVSCSHAHVSGPSEAQDSVDYLAPEQAPGPFDGELAPPPPNHEAIAFDADGLAAVRRFTFAHAAQAGLGATRTSDLVLAVNELATNSVRYGGGRGAVLMWEDGEAVVCEVRDAGRMSDPLAGRHRPDPSLPGGRGLFMVNHLCDLVQIRSRAQGTSVRLRMAGGDASLLESAGQRLL